MKIIISDDEKIFSIIIAILRAINKFIDISN